MRLIRYWFKTDRGTGYGVTAASRNEAMRLLERYGYPLPLERVVNVTEGVTTAALDREHVLPYAGPLLMRGVWFPCHNV